MDDDNGVIVYEHGPVSVAAMWQIANEVRDALTSASIQVGRPMGIPTASVRPLRQFSSMRIDT